MSNTIKLKSIEDLERNCHGVINLAPNTIYVFDNPVRASHLAKRKAKRFNNARYQKVLLTNKG